MVSLSRNIYILPSFKLHCYSFKLYKCHTFNYTPMLTSIAVLMQTHFLIWKNCNLFYLISQTITKDLISSPCSVIQRQSISIFSKLFLNVDYKILYIVFCIFTFNINCIVSIYNNNIFCSIYHNQFIFTMVYYRCISCFVIYYVVKFLVFCH